MKLNIAKNPEEATVFEDSVVLVPSSDQWNDYGVRAFVDFFVVLRGEIVLEERTKAIDLNDPERSFSHKIAEELSKGSNSLKGFSFASAIQSLSVYRTLYSRLGRTKANSVLRLLRDVAFANTSTKSPAWLSKAAQLRQMHEVLLRDSESHFAFFSLDKIVSSAGESFGLASESIHLNAAIAGFENPHELRFSWSADSPVPRRFNVLVGENGSGKTQSLRAVVRALLSNNKSIRDASTDRRPVFSRLVYMGTVGDNCAVRVRNPAMPYFPVKMPGALHRSLARLLGKLLQNEDRIAGRSRIEIFIESLDAVFSVGDLRINLSGFDCVSIHEIADIYASGSSQRRIRIVAEMASASIVNRAGRRLSSGHSQYLWMVLNICASVENGSLILIDEPEAHLHPSLISQFAAVLNSALRATGSFAVLATHSAYLVREVPSDCVLVVRAKAARVAIGNPSLKTFGADIGAVSYFVFEDELIARMLADVAQSISVGGDPGTYLDDVSTSARMALLPLFER